MCLAAADNEREGRSVSWTAPSSLWLRIPDFKTLSDAKKSPAENKLIK